jgi:glycosyltransferase involved in cell wall biosynthesis
MPAVAIIIPARNEAHNIGAVLTDALHHAPDATVIVVDDHSSDSTLDEARKIAGVIIVHSGVSLGIGGAMQLGVKCALRRGCDVFVRMDGDGQHDARFIGQLVAQAAPKTLIIGSRTETSFVRSSDPVRYAGSVFFRMLFTLFTKDIISDPTSGFVCFGRDVALQFAGYLPAEYPEIESCVLLLRAGYTVKTVGVVMRSRVGGRSSITVFRSIVYMVSVTLAFAVSFFRENPYRL